MGTLDVGLEYTVNTIKKLSITIENFKQSDYIKQYNWSKFIKLEVLEIMYSNKNNPKYESSKSTINIKI